MARKGQICSQDGQRASAQHNGHRVVEAIISGVHATISPPTHAVRPRTISVFAHWLESRFQFRSLCRRDNSSFGLIDTSRSAGAPGNPGSCYNPFG